MNGKICLITGASSGIGKQTALELARMGARLIIVNRDRERDAKALADIRTASGITNLAEQVATAHLLSDHLSGVEDEEREEFVL